jgi:hypothetical protein
MFSVTITLALCKGVPVIYICEMFTLASGTICCKLYRIKNLTLRVTEVDAKVNLIPV